MRTYFCFLIPRTDVSARLHVRCALLLLISGIFFMPSLMAQKCPGGLDSIQQISVAVECDGSILIAWDAHPDKCYTFSIPGIITQSDVSSGKVGLTGSGAGISTGTHFYVNESCSSTATTDPCQPHSGGSTSVDIYQGILPDLGSQGTWNFAPSGSSANTKDVGTEFSGSSPSDLPNILSDSKLEAETSSIIRPSGLGTTDAEYCIEASFEPGILDSISLIGDNVIGEESSGLLSNSADENSFCIANVGAGTYTNQIIAYRGRCIDTLSNIQTVIQPGSDVPTLACNGYVKISLTGSGSVVTPGMMLPGQSTVNRITYIDGTNTNFIDCSHVGKNVKVVVLDTVYNQRCWGVVTVRDISIPTVTARDTVISCLDNMDFLTSENLLNIATNCDDLSSYNITFSDIKTPGDCDSGDTLKFIERTWIIRNPSGGIINAVSNILIENIPFDTLIFPGDTTIYCPDTSFAISNTGGLNFDIDTLVTYCKLQVGFTDRTIPTGCSGMKKVERTWLAIDWCNNTMTDTVQYITLLDTLPPVLVCPVGDANGSRKILTTLDTCGAYFVIPSFSATDVCSDDSLITYDVRVGGIFIQNMDSVFMPVGENIVEYIARDDCGNETSCMDTISVEDNTPPTINGPTLIQVTHSGTGNTLIPINLFSQAFDIDDNCALDSIFIRRLSSECGIPSDTIFGQSINICCVDTDTLVEVELMARDSFGLTNTLTVFIDPKDGTAPTIGCRDTIVYLNASGEFILNDSSLFITNLSDNCGFDISVDLSRDTLVRADTNAVVQLVVTATDIDGSSASCTSMVTVRDTFTNSGVNLLIGRVSDPFDIGLGGLEVTLISKNNNSTKYITDEKGLVNLPNLSASDDLSIMIEGYGNELSGISSLDLFLIQKHILGLQPLNNNYLELAADIDQSGEVSVRDLIGLQNSILDLPNRVALPWIFLEENQVANDIIYTSSELIPIQPTDIDFRAVKIGDVNGNIYNEASGRENGSVSVLLEEIALDPNKRHELPISILPKDGMVSFHLTLESHDLNDVTFTPSDRFGSGISIQWTYSGTSLQIIGFGEFNASNIIELGILSLESSKNVESKEVFTISENSELYSSELKRHAVELAWYQKDQNNFSSLDKIFEVFPNPAVERVNFEIAKDVSEIISFTIVDIAGKEIINLSKSNNKKFSLPTTVFPSSGSYIVNIETDRGVQNDILLINKK